MYSLDTVAAAVSLADTLQNHGGNYSGPMRDEHLNQRESRGNREEDISEVKVTGLEVQLDTVEWEKVESGDDSKISNELPLPGTGNRRGGKDLGQKIMSLFQGNWHLSHQYTSRKVQEANGCSEESSPLTEPRSSSIS